MPVVEMLDSCPILPYRILLRYMVDPPPLSQLGRSLSISSRAEDIKAVCKAGCCISSNEIRLKEYLLFWMLSELEAQEINTIEHKTIIIVI